MSPNEEVSLRAVSPFEAHLLEILRFFLRGEPLAAGAAEAAAEQVFSAYAAAPPSVLIFRRCPRPQCLSRTGVELVQDTLRKGCPLLLARSSGWQRERHLRDGRVVEGRLWERSPAQELRLSFSAHALEFLIWITAENPADKKAVWPSPPAEQLTYGDQLLLYRVFVVLRHTMLAATLRAEPLFASNPLCRLACADSFGGVELGEIDFLPWTKGTGACILEALQLDLARHWLQAERGKAQVAEWQAMQAMGRSQAEVIDRFCAALESAGRLDLARFLLVALAETLGGGVPEVSRWTGGLLQRGPRLADRAETSRAALALVRQTERLSRWTQQARGVAFFEENYAASQLWKADWERWQGEALHARALDLLRASEPLQARGGET